MREAVDVIIRPVVTEKSTEQADVANEYTFIVANTANKHEVAAAVEKLWDVTVKDVRTMRYPGKAKRAMLGRMVRSWEIGRRPSFKKAVVRVAEGDHIELYEAG